MKNLLLNQPFGNGYYPYVSYNSDETVTIIKEAPQLNYFWIENLSDEIATFNVNQEVEWGGDDSDIFYITLDYSFNKETWETVNNKNDEYIEITIPAHTKLYLRGDNNYFANLFCFHQFYCDKKHNIGGLLISLLNKLCTINTLAPSAFAQLFKHDNNLSDASQLVLPNVISNHCYSNMFDYSGLVNAPSLPATTLTKYCYINMFGHCYSLVTPPELPATTLAEHCYNSMFYMCTSLTTPPELPATTLAEGCYQNMFYNCTALTTAPELPATTLAKSCYSNMFERCTSLVTPPELPAIAMMYSCYGDMFNNCTSLTTAPELPATTLAEHCYNSMFCNCTSLVKAPVILPSTKLEKMCYMWMFGGCTSLTTAPELPATTLVDYCYCYMFDGCIKLNYIKALFRSKTINSNNGWTNNISTTGTFIKNIDADFSTGYLGLPSGWTIISADDVA